MTSSDPLQPNANRRRFQRILFDAPCLLHQGDHSWHTRLLDISLKGLLVERPANWNADPTKPLEATVQLNDQTAAIVMALETAHATAQQLGFNCQYIDIESATHLRRLVELNLGDQALLDRELSALGHA